MSWQAASFVVLSAGLLLGFAWYERTRPSSSMLALVATLGALAAVGRMAFAAIPDVKPTTDIVLIAGYALGGPPGFVVGAIAPLASNVFMGEGPWTPWQMFAWGVVGLAGAGLARVGRRGLGRIPLAIACGVAAVIFNAIMDFSTWVTYTGDLTLGRYLLIEGQAVAFNVTHVVASILFFLAFGPGLVRALLRFRARLEVRWLPVSVATLALVALLPAPALAARPSARTAALTREVAYLTRAQNRDGGFGAEPGLRSNQLNTSWAILGLAAAGGDRRVLRRAAAWILVHQADLAGTGDRERTILALTAAGLEPPARIVAELRADQRPNGAFGGFVNLTAFGIFALRSTGRPAADRAIRRAGTWLARQQDADGGFNFAGRGGASGVDDTAGAVQGLVSARAGGRRLTARAVAFLRSQQNADGGFPLTPGGDSNAQSTAWAVQGLLAAGVDSGRVRHAGSRTPLGYLQSLTGPDGSVHYSRVSRQSPVWVTAQALTALAAKPFPIAVLRRPPRAVATTARLLTRRQWTGLAALLRVAW